MTLGRQLYGSSNHQVRKHKPDYQILIITALLLALGVIVMVSISPALTSQSNVPGSYFVFRQMVAMTIGSILFLVCSKLPEQFFRRTQRLFIFACLLSAGLVLAISGVAYRWIQFGGFSFQPAELMKFTTVIVTAIFLADRLKAQENKDTKKTIYPIAGGLAVLGFIVVILERDLGSMIVMLSIVFTMMLIVNVPIKRLLIGGLLIVFAIILSIVSTPYRRDRLSIYFNPEKDCTTTGYHACQALIAVGSGGLFGLGLGNSVQAYGYLPEASNDSIFAIYAEKFGFMGSLILLTVYGALLCRILIIVRRAGDTFGKLVVSGVFAWYASQAFINIGAMTGLLPLKGITLPFISYGGTSMMFVLASLGLVYRASGYTLIRKANNRYEGGGRKYERKNIDSNRRRYSGTYHTTSSSS